MGCCELNEQLKILKDQYYDVYRYISQNDLSILPLGRHELANGIYVNIDEYITKSRRELRFEAHKKFTDIQYMIYGQELITTAAPQKLELLEQYDCKKDIEFYKNSTEGLDHYLIKDSFLIISPGIAHMPCICVDEQIRVRKAVFKIPNGGGL